LQLPCDSIIQRKIILLQVPMPSTDLSSRGIFAKAWQWFKNQIVADVPPETAVCEFDCRKQECKQDDWAKCERRLSHAAGELPPSHPRDAKP
jgi:hypothetical protein